MKKVMVSVTILVLFLFIVGCVDYKAYDVPQEDNSTQVNDDASLVKEIAQVEKDVQASGKTASNASKMDVSKTEAKNTTAKPNSTTETKKLEPTVKEVTVPKPTQPAKAEDVKQLKIQSDNKEELVVKVKESELLKLKVNATDPDKEQVVLTYGKPFNEKGEWQTNYGDAGDYLSSISASDGKLTTLQKLKISVLRVNVPPTIEGLQDLVVKEGDFVKISPKIVDPNNDPVTITISTPLDNGKWQTDFKSAGEYLIKVRASDGELATEKKLKLTVENVNVAPKIEGVQTQIRVKEGDLISLKAVVTDPDEGDKVKVTISKPIGDTGVWQTDYTDHGEYDVTVTATDGKDTTKKEVHIVIDDVNAPPVISDIIVQRE